MAWGNDLLLGLGTEFNKHVIDHSFSLGAGAKE